ncbi:MAG: hypothetical protein QNJ45_09065 [Ardenticatenaceae bacterium]|nr:hypothetical protein [Ardenticatenaceae bacterium]
MKISCEKLSDFRRLRITAKTTVLAVLKLWTGGLDETKAFV